MARSLSNANAGLYRCVPCKGAGVTAYGSKRVRVRGPLAAEWSVKDGGMIALCEMHRAAYDVARGVKREDGNGAILSAIADAPVLAAAAVTLADNVKAAWQCVDTATMRELMRLSRVKSGDNASDAYSILSDTFVTRLAQRATDLGVVPADVPADVVGKILHDMTGVAVRKNSERNHDGEHGYTVRTLGDIEGTQHEAGRVVRSTLSAVDGIGFRADVLAEMDPADVDALTAYADRDEADAREATRHEAAAWSAGRMVPVTGASERVTRAALAYLEMRAAVDAR